MNDEGTIYGNKVWKGVNEARQLVRQGKEDLIIRKEGHTLWLNGVLLMPDGLAVKFLRMEMPVLIDRSDGVILFIQEQIPSEEGASVDMGIREYRACIWTEGSGPFELKSHQWLIEGSKYLDDNLRHRLVQMGMEHELAGAMVQHKRECVESWVEGCHESESYSSRGLINMLASALTKRIQS